MNLRQKYEYQRLVHPLLKLIANAKLSPYWVSDYAVGYVNGYVAQAIGVLISKGIICESDRMLGYREGCQILGVECRIGPGHEHSEDYIQGGDNGQAEFLNGWEGYDLVGFDYYLTSGEKGNEHL